MLNKLLYVIIFLSLSSIFLSLDNGLNDVEYKELSKLGKIELYGQSWVYLNLQDYKKGDKIYLEYIFSSITFYYHDIGLLISETNNYKETNKYAKEVIYESKCFQDKIDIVVDHSCHYKYELTGNYKYLIIITPIFDYYFTNMIEPQYLKHNKKFLGDDNVALWFIIIIWGIIIIIICPVLIYLIYTKRFFCRKKSIINNQLTRDGQILID